MNSKKYLSEMLKHEIDLKFQEELARIGREVQIRKQGEVRKALKNFYGNVRKIINETVM
ncbi:hypothetical protein HYU40_05070 [Candidatus Woesearchaeota archaeon]|nr:hypothetical protein [Candidatus Woesearchaeota archaeon]